MPTPTPEQIAGNLFQAYSRQGSMDTWDINYPGLTGSIATALREYAESESATLRERLAAAEQERDRLRGALSACWEVSGDPVLVAELAEKALGMPRERGGGNG